MPRSRRTCKACHTSAAAAGQEKTSYFRLPKHQAIREQWLHFLGVQDDEKYSSRIFLICSKHFEEKLLYQNNNRLLLKPGSVPSLYPPNGVVRITNLPTNLVDDDPQDKTTSDVNCSWHKAEPLSADDTSHEAEFLPVDAVVQDAESSTVDVEDEANGEDHHDVPSERKPPIVEDLENIPADVGDERVIGVSPLRDDREIDVLNKLAASETPRVPPLKLESVSSPASGNLLIASDDTLYKYSRNLTPIERKLRRTCQYMRRDNRKLRRELTKLKAENRNRQAFKAKVLDYLRERLPPYFFALLVAQLDNASKGNQGRRWSLEVKAICLALQTRSLSGYNLLRKLMPLPSPKSLGRLNRQSPVSMRVADIFDAFKEGDKRQSRDAESVPSSSAEA